MDLLSPSHAAASQHFFQGLQTATGKRRKHGDTTAVTTGTDGLEYSVKGNIRFSQTRVQDLRAHLVKTGLLYDDKGIDMMPTVKQRHGDSVHVFVPAGYVDQVDNLESCV